MAEHFFGQLYHETAKGSLQVPVPSAAYGPNSPQEQQHGAQGVMSPHTPASKSTAGATAADAASALNDSTDVKASDMDDLQCKAVPHSCQSSTSRLTCVLYCILLLPSHAATQHCAQQCMYAAAERQPARRPNSVLPQTY